MDWSHEQLGDMSDKVVVVTGGNSGIGEATVHAYAREGASVAIMARRSEEGTKVKDFVRNQGGTAEFIECDVSKPDAIKEAVNKTCLLYTSPSPRDRSLSRMPSSA